MTAPFAFDVFLSHSAKDKPRVLRLAERLREAGLRVWLDDWIIRPGDDIYLAIERGLEASRVQVLCLSQTAVQSEWVGLERSTVLFRDPSNTGRRFIPLLLEDCKPPDTLRRYRHIDFRQETDAAFQELLAACRGDEERAPLPARSRRCELRAPPADFTGRTEELADLLNQMGPAGVAISAVHGQGGIGKTALALKVAEAVRSRYPDAQFDIDLKGAGPDPLSPVAVMAHVIHAYRPNEKLPDDEGRVGGLYRSVLDGQRALLLFDNARDATQVKPLIPPKSCLMLVTSRVRFALPGLYARNLDEMKPGEAADLLRAKAPRLDADSADAIAKLCGYLPLALDLAGSTIAEQPDLEPAEYIARLRKAESRFEPVDAALGLSLELVHARARSLWCKLGVFPGDFDIEAAVAVGGRDPEASRDWVRDLLRHSLIAWSDVTKRYRLHDLARLYAMRQLGPAEQDAAERRHAKHFVQVGEAANQLYKQGGASIEKALGLFDQEWANIQAGQAWAAKHAKDDDEAAHFCCDYPLHWVYCIELRLLPQSRIAWLQPAVEAARRIGRRIDEGAALGNMGTAYAVLGDLRRAIELYEQRLTIAREMGDRRGEGNALGNMGNVYAALDEPRRAIELYEQDLTIAREIGDRRGEGNMLGNMGNVYATLGDPRRAIELYEQRLTIAREIGDRRGEAAASWNLGFCYEALGELDKAIEAMQVCIDFERAIGHTDAEKHAAQVAELRARRQG